MRLKKLQLSFKARENMSYFFSCFSEQFYHFCIFYNEHIFFIIKIRVFKKIRKNAYGKCHCAEYFCSLAIPHNFFLENEKHKVFFYAGMILLQS